MPTTHLKCIVCHTTLSGKQRKYCSRKCGNVIQNRRNGAKSRKGRTHCKKCLSKLPKNHSVWCSDKCRDEYNKITSITNSIHNCPTCGAVVTDKKKYCSTKCMNSTPSAKESIERYRKSPRGKEAQRRATKRYYDIHGHRHKLSNLTVSIILKSQDNKCAICHTDLYENYHVDHIIPVVILKAFNLSNETINSIINLQVTCPSCNLRKSDKVMEEHRHLIETLLNHEEMATCPRS